MESEDFKNIVKEIVVQAQELMQKYISEQAPVNYACIFCQNDKEYESFFKFAKQIGKVIQETKTGSIFQIEPLLTVAGKLQLLKIRNPDSTRLERGDADFTLLNYDKFKNEFLGKKGFKLIKRDNFEMIELMDQNFNVRVYFSDPSLDKQLGLV